MSTKHRDESAANSANENPEQIDNINQPHQGAPIERYRGERNIRGGRNIQLTGSEGDLEEETLDADAPYNKTYGREKPISSNQDEANSQ